MLNSAVNKIQKKETFLNDTTRHKQNISFIINILILKLSDFT